MKEKRKYANDKKKKSRRSEFGLIEADGRVSDDIADPPGQQSLYVPPGDIRRESYRLSTFEQFPVTCSISRKSLAKSGFFFTGFYDRVKCFACARTVERWEETDNPAELKWHNQNCPFPKGQECGNVSLPNLFQAITPVPAAGSPFSASQSANQDGSTIDRCQTVLIGDHIEAIDGDSLVGCRHFEVARRLKKIPVDTTCTMTLIEPRKAFGYLSREVQHFIEKLESSITKEERLKLFHEILEYGSWKQQDIAKTIRSIDFSGILLQSRDVSVIGFVINHSAHLDSVNLKACQLLPGYLQNLSKGVVKIVKVDKFRVDGNPDLTVHDLIAGVDLCARVGARYVYDLYHLSASDRQKFGSHCRKYQPKDENVEKKISKKRKFLTREERFQKMYKKPSSNERGRIRKVLDFNSKLDGQLGVEPAERGKEDSEVKMTPGNFLGEENVGFPQLDIKPLGGESSSGATRKIRPRTLKEFVKLKPVVKFNKMMKSASSGEEDLEAGGRAMHARMLKTMALNSDRRRFESASLNKFGSKLRSHIRNTRLEVSTGIVKSSKDDSGYKSRSSFSQTLSCKSSLRRYSRLSDQDTERKSSIESTQAASLEMIEEIETSAENSGSSDSGTPPMTGTQCQKHTHDPMRLIEQRFEMTVLGLGVLHNRQEQLQLWMENAEFDVLPTDLGQREDEIILKHVIATLNDLIGLIERSESDMVAMKNNDGTETETRDQLEDKMISNPTAFLTDDRSKSDMVNMKGNEETETESGGRVSKQEEDKEVRPAISLTINQTIHCNTVHNDNSFTAKNCATNGGKFQLSETECSSTVLSQREDTKHITATLHDLIDMIDRSKSDMIAMKNNDGTETETRARTKSLAPGQPEDKIISKPTATLIDDRSESDMVAMTTSDGMETESGGQREEAEDEMISKHVTATLNDLIDMIDRSESDMVAMKNNDGTETETRGQPEDKIISKPTATLIDDRSESDMVAMTTSDGMETEGGESELRKRGQRVSSSPEPADRSEENTRVDAHGQGGSIVAGGDVNLISKDVIWMVIAILIFIFLYTLVLHYSFFNSLNTLIANKR